MPELLQIFAKAPTAGRVKTRLIPLLGTEGACALHRALLERCLAELAPARPAQLWCAPDTAHPYFQDCAARFGVELRRQPGPDLGARMARALRAGLAQARKVTLIGCDCPGLDRAYLQAGFAALEQAEAVLGPAADGGYVLIGLRRPLPELFTDMPWGTAQVLALTRERLRASGVAWRELPALWDVDRPPDVARLRETGFAW